MNILLGVGAFGVLAATLMLGGSYVEYASKKWPRIQGRVVWVGRNRDDRLGKDTNDLTSLRMRVETEWQGKELQLLFTNVPPQVQVGEQVTVMVNPTAPSLLNNYEDRWREVNLVRSRVFFVIGTALSLLFLCVSAYIVFLALSS